MELSIRDVLDLEVFKLADAKVVAGEDQLDRKVRWVHISELPDIAYLLKGGELLLTTGVGLSDDHGTQKRFIEEISQIGVAGVVIELGRAFDQVPPALVEEANNREVPVIALHNETRFVDVTEQVHSAIINRQYEFLRKAEAINRDFTGLVLSGSGVRQLVRHLAELVQNPVVLEDGAHQVVDYASYTTSLDPLLDEWEGHSREGHTVLGEIYSSLSNGGPRCAWTPIIFRDETWGRLHLLELDRSFDEMDQVVLDRAGAAVGLALLADRDAAHLSDHARGALLSDILQGRFVSSTEFLTRAKNLGADFGQRRLAVVIAEPVELGMWVEQQGISERDRQRMMLNLRDEVRQTFIGERWTALSTTEGDRVVSLVGIPGTDEFRQALDDLAQDIVTKLGRLLPGIETVVGISRQADAKRLQEAFEEATEAVRFGRTAGRTSSIHHFGDLGLHQLFIRLAEGADLARFVESELSPLLSHDASTRVRLLPTLSAFLDAGGSKSNTARVLGIKRRSVYHRLDKIRGLLGMDLDDADTRVRLLVALRGLDFLKMRAPAR